MNVMSQAIPAGGMNLNDSPLSFAEGDYGWTLNGFLSNSTFVDRILGIMPGNIFRSAVTPGYMPLGFTRMTDGRIAICSTNPSEKMDEIGTFVNGTYQMKIRANMNFRLDKPIDMESKGSTIYFTDDYNPMRHTDVDNPILLPNGDLDLRRLKIFADYQIPDITVESVQENGAARAGAYFICAQYANKVKQGLTVFSTPIGPLNIFSSPLSDSFDYIQGSPADEVTSKSFTVKLDNVDRSFDYMNICIIRQVNGVKRAFIVATIDTQQTSYTYTGFGNDQVEISLNQVIDPGTSYETAKCISRSADILLMGNLTSKKVYNIQPYVSKMKVMWRAYGIAAGLTEESYKDPIFTMEHTGYRAGEVAPVGFVIRWNDGTKSPVYPLVGREKNKSSLGNDMVNTEDQYGNAIPAGEWDSYRGLTGIDIYETDSPERWKMFNTATIENLTINSRGVIMEGEAGFYESTERYPDNIEVWGELAGQPIRFPRMPDRSIVPMTGTDPTIPGDNKNVINILGIHIPNLDQIIDQFPQEVKDRMQGWEIVRANREFNESVVASGLIHNTRIYNWNDELDEEKRDERITPNYPLNDLRNDFFIYEPYIMNGRMYTNVRNRSPRYKKDIFNFYSPDTAFKRKFIKSQELTIETEMHGAAELSWDYVTPYTGFLINNRDNYDPTAVHGVAIGRYQNYLKPKYGNIRRRVVDAIYVGFNTETLGSGIGEKIHNRTRDSAVFLRTEKPIDDPTNPDTSRGNLNDTDQYIVTNSNPPDPEYDAVARAHTWHYLQDFNGELTTRRVDPNGVVSFSDVDGFNPRTTSAYYVTLKNFIPDQYGPISSIVWLFTGHTNYNTNSNTTIFGGDTYIGQFSLKKQFVFFKTAQLYKNSPTERNVDLHNTETVPHTLYWYYAGGRSVEHRVQNINKGPHGSGYVPLIFTGIPLFYVESSVNFLLRHNGVLPHETFYPNLQNGSLTVREWSGIEQVDKDNDFRYNTDYSATNDLASYISLDQGYDPSERIYDHPTRVIVSLASNPQQRYDNWLVFKANNYYDLPESALELIDIAYLGGLKTMFRCRNEIYIDSVYSQIGTTDGELTLGTGELFQRKPLDVIKSDDRFSGTNSQWAFNSTKFGHFMVDGNTGNVFRYSEQMTCITTMNQKVDKWFNRELPLKLLKDVPSFPNADNPHNPEGIGYCSTYDPATGLWLLTKRDYSVINRNQVKYSSVVDGKLHFNGVPVSLNDTSIFRNESFTVGYDPIRDRWVSFYSFIPGFYFSDVWNFYSFNTVASDNTIYEHSSINRPRTYYNKRNPFITELIYKRKEGGPAMLKSMTMYTRSSMDGVEFPLATFNKAIFYNSNQSTGLVNLNVIDETDLTSMFNSWIPNPSNLNLTRNRKTWSTNQLLDRTLDKSKAIFSSQWEDIKDQYPIDKVINISNFETGQHPGTETEFNDHWLAARLILDSDKDIELFLYFTAALENQVPAV